MYIQFYHFNPLPTYQLKSTKVLSHRPPDNVEQFLKNILSIWEFWYKNSLIFFSIIEAFLILKVFGIYLYYLMFHQCIKNISYFRRLLKVPGVVESVLQLFIENRSLDLSGSNLQHDITFQDLFEIYYTIKHEINMRI